jgi:hypothetical protein
VLTLQSFQAPLHQGRIRDGRGGRCNGAADAALPNLMEDTWVSFDMILGLFLDMILGLF